MIMGTQLICVYNRVIMRLRSKSLELEMVEAMHTTFWQICFDTFKKLHGIEDNQLQTSITNALPNMDVLVGSDFSCTSTKCRFFIFQTWNIKLICLAALSNCSLFSNKIRNCFYFAKKSIVNYLVTHCRNINIHFYLWLNFI